jgi:ATP-dependent DNA ligase
MSRNGHDLASRFPQIVEALRSLPVQSWFYEYNQF